MHALGVVAEQRRRVAGHQLGHDANDIAGAQELRGRFADLAAKELTAAA